MLSRYLYVACYLWDVLSCSLPWQGLKAGTKKQKYEKISEKKVATSIEVESCLGRQFYLYVVVLPPDFHLLI